MKDNSFLEYLALFGLIAASAVVTVLYIKVRTRFLFKVLKLQTKEERERDFKTLHQRNNIS